jgi:hypothetical protein
MTFTTNDYISAARLHALIDTAIAAGDAFPGTPTLYGIVMGDFVAGLKAFHLVDSPSSPATNELQVGSDGLLNKYDGSNFVDLTSNLAYYVNNSAITLTTGTPVVPDPASATGCNIYAQAGTCPDPLGISQTVCAPGATASIAVRGPCIAAVYTAILVSSEGDHLSLQGAGATMLTKTTSVGTEVMAFAGPGPVSDPTSPLRLVFLVR